MSSLRTPLARVKGLGSAKDGTDHFWHQRLTAIGLVPLCIWFCFSMASLPAMDYATFVSWISSPFSAVMMILVLLAGFYHAALGLQVIVEDYIGDKGVRTASLIAIKIACVFLAVTGVFSVLKLSFAS